MAGYVGSNIGEGDEDQEQRRRTAGRQEVVRDPDHIVLHSDLCCTDESPMGVYEGQERLIRECTPLVRLQAKMAMVMC